MQLSEINQELSIRLGDPVDTPQTDGKVFSSDQRLKYITRAYGKLTRLLRITMRDYQPEYNRVKMTQTIPIMKGKDEFYLAPFVELDEIFVQVSYMEGTLSKIGNFPCSFMDPNKYLSNKYGVNDIKAPLFSDLKFKYTIISPPNQALSTIKLLPLPDTKNYYISAEVLWIPDLQQMNWTSALPITRDYMDLLIDLATVQGMQDIARADKAQMIERAIDREIQILGQYGSYMKQVEGVKE